jgi:lysophospholipid acyltransferase (LPLAT)-like uncharacterized protein
MSGGSSALTRVAPPLAAMAVRLLAATLRVRAVGTEALAPIWAAGRPIIYVVWHGRILLAPWVNEWLRRTSGARTVCVLASRSRDGEMVARYARRFGLDVVRGSSSRGGAAAVRALVACLRGGEDVTIVPDGPRGPRGYMQSGAVTLAALSGAPVVPLAVGARPAWRLRTWDALLVPAPFGRCVAVFGPPLFVTRAADRELARKELEQALHETTLEADRLVNA